ncbi:MAG: LacI family DNA-binding transcriptional regulator [Microbacterium gubbeenense]
MVTMQDVARAAGVSPMTVSNVVNDRPHIKPATRTRVLAAIDDLGYRINAAGRNLRTGRTGTIGLAVPEVDNPYFSHLIARVVEEAARHRLRIAIEQTGAAREAELEVVSMSRNRLYDGLLLSTAGLAAGDQDLLQVDYPIVLLGESMFDAPLDHIVMPNREGSREAAEHLLARGCRRVAYLRRHDTDEDPRLAGYLDAMATADREPLFIDIDGFGTVAAARAVAAAMAEDNAPDGIACSTDSLAFGAMRGVVDAGLRVPEDVRITGYDDVPMASIIMPSLTTIAPDHEAAARTALEFLVERLNGSAEPPRTYTIPHALRIRDSSR